MDPSSPEFQPQSSRPTEPRPPAASESSKSRTTCRVCAETFVSRNQLMRHLYKTHPKNSKPKTSSKSSQPVQPLTSPIPASSKPVQPQPRVHPFSLLSQEQQIDFAGHVVLALFAVGMRQKEEEEDQQRQQGQDFQNHDHESTEPQPGVPPQNDAGLPIAKSDTPAAPRARPDHRKAVDDSESEDSDDEDGGVVLFEPSESLGDLQLGLGVHDLEELGEDLILD